MSTTTVNLNFHRDDYPSKTVRVSIPSERIVSKRLVGNIIDRLFAQNLANSIWDDNNNNNKISPRDSVGILDGTQSHRLYLHYFSWVEWKVFFVA